MKAINTILDRFEEIIVAVTLAVASILTFIEVVLRYIFNSSLGFTHELVIFLLIFTGLIGASIGVRHRIHLGVYIVVKQFPAKMQKSIRLLCMVLNILFSFIVTYLGFQHIDILKKFGQLSPELLIPLYIPILVIPIAFGLMTIRFIQQLFIFIKMPAEELMSLEEGGHE